MSEKVIQQPKNNSKVLKRQKPETDDGANVHQDAALLQNFSPTRASDVLRMQRTLGNHATLSMLQRAEASKKQGAPQISQTQPEGIQRAVDATGAPTELDPVTDAKMIADLQGQYLTFQQNIIGFWDSYKLPHPANEQALFQQLWGLYLDGLKQSSAPQSKLATVKQVERDDKKANMWVPGKINTRGVAPTERQKIDAPGYKSILGYKPTRHPDQPLPTTKEQRQNQAEEQALRDQMGVMRMQYADEAISKMQGLVAAFAKEFDKAVAKVKENADQANKDRPWYKALSKKKKPTYIFWSGGSAKAYVEHKHSPEDTIMLEMTMGKMAWLTGLSSTKTGVDPASGDDIMTPNAITAYTGENFQIWTALSEKYAFTAAMQAQRGQKWNFVGYMSDIPVDEQSVYNTIERPTLLNEYGADLDITWRMIDADPNYLKKIRQAELEKAKTGQAIDKREWTPKESLILVKESKNRNNIVEAIRKANAKKEKDEERHKAKLKEAEMKFKAKGKKGTP